MLMDTIVTALFCAVLGFIAAFIGVFLRRK